MFGAYAQPSCAGLTLASIFLLSSTNFLIDGLPVKPGNDGEYLPDRLQPGLDLGAARLEERRQCQFFAERRHRLVGGKAGTVGSDLEQDAIGLAEIQAAKIEPVDRAAVADAEFIQPRQPRLVLRMVGRAKCDVVDAARALMRDRPSITCNSAAGPPSPVANTSMRPGAPGAA